MENLSYLLIKASRHLKNSLDKKLSKFNVTAAQFSVLNQIANKNGLITSAEVASNLDSDRPTISVIINRLEEKKLIEKVSNPEDKRSVYLRLSKDVFELMKELRMASDQLNCDIFSDFDKNEIDNIKGYLFKIIDKVEKI
ncbi:MarR family winged helix-turn-helix transcriptional regulator [Alkaliphilus hydrothermalis]|uniref:DNA-binding MarR family transcriptional regulator n=1 Tax=Alkaliphilus hydrothermalis TaxID=1482730 RepID=A0ABS2NMC3_9FIRM|nr:MarR family transcriptional regulator [Alkaliphilus hydrothermalis]MBM7614066.1 DNA-binding MarR family transcriptional regulator [Alkaliphilus hydrothermalis]